MQEIFDFLKDLAAHNDREWFQENRSRYEAAAAEFERITADMIGRIAKFEPGVSNMPAKNALFRIYRDTRFSTDKRPYKEWMGAYINPRGRKSMHGGYYLHLQPGGCMVAGGCWWFEPKVLREVRESIVLRLPEFESIVEQPDFKKHFPQIGEYPLKTMPKGFPKDFPRPEYLRPRTYVVWENLPDRFFLQKGWEAKATKRFQLMQPFINFVNDTVDDYI